MLARLRASQLLQKSGIEYKLIGTIHDSIVADCPSTYLKGVATILRTAVEDVPRFVRQIWDYDFSLPLTCEVSYGPNKTDMKEWKFD